MRASGERTIVFPKIAVIGAALAIATLAVPVTAQTEATVITPLKAQPDVNDVNIGTGQMRVAVPSLAAPAAPRLRFDSLQNAVPYLSANLSGGSGSYIESSIAVHTGASASESFRCTYDDVCVNRKQNGAVIDGAVALGGPYWFTESQSGAVYAFDSLQFDNGAHQQNRQVQYYATSITYPDGEVISFTYDKATYSSGSVTHHRLTRMSSNLGYHIAFTYEGSDVNYPTWFALRQAALYRSAEPATPLGRLSYAANGMITDLAGRIYACSDCRNGIGSPAEWSSVSLTLPGEGNAQIVATPIAVPNSGHTVVSAVVRDGVTWSYSYANLRTKPRPQEYTYDYVTVTGPAGYSARYNIVPTIGGGPNLVGSSVDSLGRTTSYSYDTNHRVTLVTAPEGNAVQIAYDSYGNITSKVSQPKPGSGLAAITESAGIDTAACGQNRVLCFRPDYYIDGLGRRTDYDYDGAGRLIQRTDPADAAGVRRVTYLSYGGSFTAPTLVRLCGLGTTCGTAAEVRTEYTYFGNTALPLTETRIDGALGISLTTTYTYDSAGRVLSVDGPLPGSDDARYARYDVLGRKTWEIGPKGANGVRNATRTTYRNADDKPVSVESGTVGDPHDAVLTVLTRTDLSYDARRNPAVEVVVADGAAHVLTQRTFDLANRPECEAQRMNPAAFGSLPASACTLGAQGTHGPDRITRTVHDAAGQLVQVQKAYGTPLQQNYAAYSYTANGQRASVVDANGNRAELRYDGFDRLSRWVFPHPATIGALNEGDYEAYGYDAAGNRTSLRKRDGATIGYQYDALNRVTRKTVPERAGLAATHTRDVFYGYDVNGQQTYARFDGPSGEGITFGWSGFGEKLSETLVMDGASRTLWSGYDANGRRTGLTHADGVRVNYHHDAASRLYYAEINGGEGLFHPQFDAAGRLARLYRLQSAVANWGHRTDYSYDPIGRLTGYYSEFNTSAYNTTVGFTRNPASQIRTRSESNPAFAWNQHIDVNRGYVSNGLNQYTSAGGAAFAYDANGNLISDGTSTYQYDVENRLVAKSGGGSAAQLRYDPLGRLYEINGSSEGLIRFLHDGDTIVAEYSGAGAMLRRYVHGTGAGDDPLVWFEGGSVASGAKRYLFADERGSITAVTDANGNAIAVNTYDEYGIPGTNAGRFQYTGQAWLPDLGMYYYKARIYSPTLGRFLQTDPIGYEDQVNLYGYVGNDPVNNADPTGMQCTGSRIEDSDGNCASTHGPTTQSIPDNTYRDRMAAAGAAAGAVVGGVAGGTGGAAGGAVLCSPGGPVAAGCAAAGGVEGAAAGAVGGAVAGGVVGGLVGTVIDKGIVLFNKATGGDDGSGGGRGSGGSPRNLGNLGGRASERTGDVAMSRGASGANVRQMGPWADKPLGEVARAAASGDRSAATALKIVKQAGRLGQKY